MPDLDSLRYPVGRFDPPKGPLDAAARRPLIDILERTPGRYRALVSGRSDAELDRPYRPDGWTVRQVVHHVPDSHMNAYLRMKWAVTEDMPTIKTYDETKWAELGEAKSGPVEMSVALLEAVHGRWLAFMRTLGEADFQRGAIHPQWKRIDVGWILAQYAWHSRHHEAHIKLGLNAT